MQLIAIPVSELAPAAEKHNRYNTCHWWKSHNTALPPVKDQLLVPWIKMNSIQMLKQQEKTPRNIPVLAMTCNIFTASQLHTLNLNKPIDWTFTLKLS